MPVPRSEIQLWPFGHDSARVDYAQAAIIVKLALVDVAGGGDARHLIERPCIPPQRRIFVDVAKVALEQRIIDRVETQQRGKQAPVGLGDCLAHEIPALGQPHLEPVERRE